MPVPPEQIRPEKGRGALLAPVNIGDDDRTGGHQGCGSHEVGAEAAHTHAFPRPNLGFIDDRTESGGEGASDERVPSGPRPTSAMVRGAFKRSNTAARMPSPLAVDDRG